MRYPMSIVCATGVFMSVAASLNAQTISLEANWSSPSGATAVATFDLDIATFNANCNGQILPGFYTFASRGLSNFTMTVTGANIGNGTFTEADFDSMVLYAGVAIDPTIEWVGQPQSAGTWGTFDATFSHDFNFFSISGAPNGTNFYTFNTASGAGEPLFLTSVHPVPAPTAAAALGLGGLASLRRRRR